MTLTDLQAIADAVIRRAQRQRYVVPREVQAELAGAGLPEDSWKDVLALARESLHYRQGRYYYLDPVRLSVQAAQSQQQITAQAVRRVMNKHVLNKSQIERRQHERIDYVQPVKVLAEDRREYTVLSRDLSPHGIRLIGSKSLLGQKVRVQLPEADGPQPFDFVVRILWTCALGDDLYENGGSFVEVAPRAGLPLKVVS
jgi:hypothetical protein